MRRSIANVLLWLFIMNLGIVLGAGLYESVIVVPEWLRAVPGSGYLWDAEAARRSNTGVRFWAFVSTGPLTLLTVANLVAAWRARGELRRWWLGAGATALVERLFTFSYFIPTMITLMQDRLPQAEAVASALRWGQLNHLRHALVLVAWLAALRAFRLSAPAAHEAAPHGLEPGSAGA